MYTPFCAVLCAGGGNIVLAADSNTGTKYASVNEFQQARWTEIENAILEKKDGTDPEFSLQSPQDFQRMLESDGYQVSADNEYFRWVDREALQKRGVAPWNGSERSVTPYTRTYTYTDTWVNELKKEEKKQQTESVTYQVYDVHNAAEFYYAMKVVGSAPANVNIKINLLNDINLNGMEQVWTPIALKGDHWCYLEGNGHTIYNMRAYGDEAAGLFGTIRDRRIIAKNLNFQSYMVLSHTKYLTSYAGALFASIAGNAGAHIYNVHARDGFVYGKGQYVGGLLGHVECANDMFVKLCSNKNTYVYGTSHVGGFSSLFAKKGVCTPTETAYDAPFPKVPEAFLKKGVYGHMAEDCYSVDCEVFSVSQGGTAADSGGMFSCGQGAVFRNCYTNNTIYGDQQTGAFIGRCIGGAAVGTLQNCVRYDDNAKKTINCFFENCYSAGSVEGEQLGGFAGYVAGAATGGTQGETPYGGNMVFKNCYTTATVGMDYAGTDLGGFIGYDESLFQEDITIDLNGKPVQVRGSAYINCYAAGEVGNILTDTTAQKVEQTEDTPRLGGFIGAHYSLPGHFENCYYDMQTTAMRERVCGMEKEHTGIEGLYTLGSKEKDVSGLTYSIDADAPSVDMKDNTAWEYVAGYYPRLAVFEKEGTDSTFFVPSAADDVAYSVPIQAWISTAAGGTVTEESLDMARTANNFSKAATAAIFLDHWDSIVDTSTGTVPEENNWVCGVKANQMTYNQEKKRWELSYKNVKAGTYEFKIQEGTSWAYNYGKDMFNGKNCELKLDETSNVTIGFSYKGDILKDGGINTQYQITADITPVGGKPYVQTLGGNEVLGNAVYVLAGTERLTGENWNTSSENMCMTDSTDDANICQITIDNVEGGYNYSYAVVPKGASRDGSRNHFFYLKDEAESGIERYKLVIDYNKTTRESNVKVYQADSDDPDSGDGTGGADSGDGTGGTGSGADPGDPGSGNDLDDPDSGDETGDQDLGEDLTAFCLEETPQMSESEDDDLIKFFSVAGDQGLTGYNWLGVEGDTDEYRQNAVESGKMEFDPDTGNYTKRYFDVAVGMDGAYSNYAFKVVANGDWDYGIDYGNNYANYEITLQSDTESETNVTISFNPNTGEVEVSTEPNVCIERNENEFQWYVASAYTLVSNDAYTSGKTVYDTIRDITGSFYMTADTELSWAVDQSWNQTHDFFDRIADGEGFTIPYTVEGKKVSGKFDGAVLNLAQTEENGVTSYRVTDFMPGKNWVQTVSGTEKDLESGLAGMRRIRVLPMTCLEAGTNSSIVVNYQNDGSIVNNRVRVTSSTEGMVLEAVDDALFSYYNFALGTGYVATDKIGQGIYHNYEGQQFAAYHADRVRDENAQDNQKPGEYYAMYSAFGQQSDYDDSDKDNSSGTNVLCVDELVKQSMIGAAYSDGAAESNTIVKIYKQNANGDYSKVFMDSDPNSASAYYRNYLKWTGKEPFTRRDRGVYRITFYWILSDGRYLSDSKYVRIDESETEGVLQISKQVTGTAGDTSQKFQFTVTVSNEQINGYYGGMAFSYGTSKFYLRDGESIQGILPAGIEYTVTETQVEGYETTVKDADGNTSSALTAEGKIDQDGIDVVSYVNHKDKVEKPEKPTDPGNPGDPTPGDPQNPTPTDPTPGEPEQPTDPEDPSPIDPDKPTPTDPEDPSPINPDKPTPGKPEDPTPEHPEKPDPVVKSPKTADMYGCETAVCSVVILFCVIGLAVVSRMKKRTDSALTL